jgi:integrase
LIWPWPHHRRTLFLRFRELVEAAGLPCPRTGHQLFHRLRRTMLSYCAAVSLPIAQQQAGHTTAAMTLRHYVDPSIARPQLPPIPVPEF